MLGFNGTQAFDAQIILSDAIINPVKNHLMDKDFQRTISHESNKGLNVPGSGNRCRCGPHSEPLAKTLSPRRIAATQAGQLELE